MTFEEFANNHKKGMTLEDFLEAVRMGFVNDNIFMDTFSNAFYKKGEKWKPCISFLNISPISSNYVAHAYVGRGTIKWLDEEHYKEDMKEVDDNGMLERNLCVV